LTEHDDVIKSLLRGTPRLGLALGPAPARAGPATRGIVGWERVPRRSHHFFVVI